MNETRLLDPEIEGDIDALESILESYKQDELNQANPVYDVEYLVKFSNWLLNNFKTINNDDFVIAANFHEGELIQIMVGYKFEIGWGQYEAHNGNPYWYVGLAYFKDKRWRPSGSHIINLGLVLGAHFERQGYYKFYTVRKMPPRLKSYDQIRKYLDSEPFKESYKIVRYNSDVEKVFYTNTDLENFTFSSFKVLLPRKIYRPVMLLSFTLDPTIDINSLKKQRLLDDPGMSIDDFIKSVKR